MRFRPRALVDVSNVETQVRILERLAALPIIIAPFGAAGFPWPRGDLAVAQCAADFGIPYAMSSTASVALAEIAARCERSEEHTSELQSLMRISYAVFCLKK